MPGRKLPHELVLAYEKDGYLQQVNWKRLEKALTGMRWVGRLCVVPGDYVHRSYPLIHLQTSEPLDEGRKAQVSALFEIGAARTTARISASASGR